MKLCSEHNFKKVPVRIKRVCTVCDGKKVAYSGGSGYWTVDDYFPDIDSDDDGESECNLCDENGQEDAWGYKNICTKCGFEE